MSQKLRPTIGLVFAVAIFAVAMWSSENHKQSLMIDATGFVHAQQIMGAMNCIGPATAKKVYGDLYHEQLDSLSPEQLAALATIPFSDSVLKECASTHILVFDLGLSLKTMWRYAGENLLVYGREDDKDEQFAKATDVPQWRLVRRDIVPGSTNMELDEQLKLLLPHERNEVRPMTRIMVNTMLLYYKECGTWLFSDNIARCCNEVGSVEYGDRQSICVGHLSSDKGVGIYRRWNTDREDNLGLASIILPMKK
ncbi:MAG: hypothetical protein WC495_01225 [Patescibacteria group bacterium]|jgi:hypothetical protein